MSKGNDKDQSYATGKDMLLLPDGSVYHVGVKAGEIHPRVVTVGSHQRADELAKLLDKTPTPLVKTSSRQFKVVSGHFNGVPVSIVAIGMGAPMLDFLMRELSFIEPGPLIVIRLGTCGLLDANLLPGSVVVATEGSNYVYRNYAFFDGCCNDDTQDGPSKAKPYLITKVVPADKALSETLLRNITDTGISAVGGSNASAETFYACQGRNHPHFHDHNDQLLNDLLQQGVASFEMESHQLLHLARLSKSPCLATACAIGIVNRVNPAFDKNITAAQLSEAESKTGLACLKTLASTALPKASNC